MYKLQYMNLSFYYLLLFMKKKRILISGLGGGLDVINASLLYFQAIHEGSEAILGSIRPAPQKRITNRTPFQDSGSWINPNTQIDYGKGVGVARYCEPKVCKAIQNNIMFFSRKFEDKNDHQRLRQAILKAKQINNIDMMFFVDGGGDSLTLKASDSAGTSQNSNDPFAGGDSLSLQALAGVANAYLAVISVGLDISEQAFQQNISLLREKNAYKGRVNLRTGEKQEYQLNEEIQFSKVNLQKYFKLTEEIVAIKNQQSKAKSHTAVVTYHALKTNFGNQRTYVPWEPEGGVDVKPEHCWMYFFDASKIHELKLEINKKN